MRSCLHVTVLLGALCVLTQAQEIHLNRVLIFVQSNVTEGEVEMEWDRDELFYVDFDKQQVVQRLPEFDTQWHMVPSYPAQETQEVDTMKYNLKAHAKGEGFPMEVIDPPVARLYPEDDVEAGVPNTLICFITDFHPPAIRVSWSRNNEPLTEGVSETQYYSNSDYSFRLFSYLSFTPQPGDVYSCTVEHIGLQEPLTRLWEPELQMDSEARETAVCAVGLTLGLLGVVSGTIFLIKGNNCN
ncbi:H-2 class II histocompatibility antigen, A-Q alpha chain [Amia ocellicauda]|uniref:H-2 class II histocompatibility antigen, A-Q alpha chain n=1 Tax=Amia ocellicauda TaxID=2972642 RepID=UPI003463BE13